MKAAAPAWREARLGAGRWRAVDPPSQLGWYGKKHPAACRLWRVLLGLAAAAGLAVPAVAAGGPTSSTAGRPAAAPPHVLLAAIGDEQPVFDRLVTDLAKRLETLQVASIVTGSASGQVGRRFGSSADVYTAIRNLRADAGGGCLVYLTGHGTKAGMSLPLAPERSPTRPYADLAVADMAAALQEGCGELPTVVVFSACYSGVYLSPDILTPNRIVLTAASADRPSFGCGDDETHSYFDGCFLRSFDAAATWRQLARRAASCVARLERKLLPGERPSRPQARFGYRMRDWPLPARR